MPTHVFKAAKFSRFCATARIADGALAEAIKRVARASGCQPWGGVFKLRVARPNEGRRGGFRTLVACVIDQRAFFMMGYGKNAWADVERKELTYFRGYGAILLGLDEATLDLAFARGELTEIGR